MGIAKTILEQLGGNKFLAMTGAKQLVALENGLQFKLPRIAGCKINCVQIILDETDTYAVKFLSIRRLDVDTVSETSGVYAEMLQELFEDTTGLCCTL